VAHAFLPALPPLLATSLVIQTTPCASFELHCGASTQLAAAALMPALVPLAPSPVRIPQRPAESRPNRGAF